MKKMQKIDLKFAEVSFDNIDEVYHIEESSFKIPWTKKSLLEAAKRKDTLYLSAIYNNRAIAYIGAWLIAEDAEITNVATLKEYRGQGAAALLMEEVLSRCKNSGMKRVTLEVRPSNLAAISLYKKFGLVENGRRKRYYADNDEDALIFWGDL